MVTVMSATRALRASVWGHTEAAAEVEDRYLQLVSHVRSSIKIPLAVKIGPFFAALPHFACRLASAGADGLVLFNRAFLISGGARPLFLLFGW